jgi:HEAT repeat protein
VPNELGRVLREQVEKQKEQQRQLLNLLQAAIDASEDDLRATLKSPAPAYRFAAAYAVGERRLFWQDDLIPLLRDGDEAVRQSARRSLVILSFMTLNPEVASAAPDKPAPLLDKLVPPRDFGPLPGASRVAQAKAVERWANWWKEEGRTVLKPVAPAREEGEAHRLSDRLVRASDEQRKELLSLYARTSGVEYTEAIAYAIPSLSGEPRREAREALAERLTGRTVPTLLRYLTDGDAEIRRAAALALGMRDARETVPEVAKLLLDPEPSVVRATHASLRSLTGEDYGPSPHATEEEKQEAVKHYQSWRPRK